MINTKFLLCILFWLLFLTASSASPEKSETYQQQGEHFYEHAQTLKKQGKYRDAVEMYEKSLAAERKSRNPRLSKIGLYLNQAALYSGEIGQTQKSLAYYQEALHVFREAGLESGVAVLLGNVGAAYSDLGELSKAMAYYKEALELNRKLGKTTRAAVNLNNIGRIYDDRGEYTQAIDYFKQALVLNRQLGNDTDIALNVNNLGGAYRSLGRYDEALEYYEQALEIDRRLGRELHTAIRLGNIGAVYFAWGQYDKALEKFEDALEIHQRLERSTGISIALNNIGRVYQKNGQYTKAIDFFQRSLALDRQTGRQLGIVSSLNNLATCHEALGELEQALALHQESLELARKLDLPKNISISLNNIGLLYTGWGRYDDALRHYQESLEIDRRQGREASVAIRLANIAQIYHRLDKYDRAFEYLQQSLDINRRLGRKEGEADGLSRFGTMFRARKEYDKALDYYQQALDIHRAFGHTSEIPDVLNNIGQVYKDLEEFQRALGFFQEALKLNQDSGRQADTATNLANLALLYNAWGRYDKALQANQKALEIYRTLNRRSKIATVLNNMGTLFDDWGQDERALDYYQQALDIHRELGEESRAAVTLNNIGLMYNQREKFEKSLEYYQQALDIANRLGDVLELSTYLGNIGSAYSDLKKADKALEYYRQALTLRQDAGEEATEQLNNIGVAYYRKGELKNALEYVHKALDDARRLEKKASVATYLHNIGSMHYFEKEYKTAVEFLAEAVNVLEQLRSTTSGEARRDYLASQILTYQFLISCYIRLGEYQKAFDVIELSRAKRLEEQLRDSNVASSNRLPSLPELQQTIPQDTAILMYAYTPENHLARFLLTSHAVVVDERELPGGRSDRRFGSNERIARNSRGLNLGGDAPEARQSPTRPADFESLISRYRQQLVGLRNAERGLALPGNAPSSQPASEQADTEDEQKNFSSISKNLYAILLGDMRQHIADKTSLLIMPDGQLNFIPFETLIDERGSYLVETFHIRYAQSLGVLQAIRTRRYPEDRKALLAFGGAVYDEKNYDIEVIEGSRQLSSLRKEVDAALERGASLRQAYDRLGFHWGNLPGSLTEVETLEDIVGEDADIFIGASVSEETVKKQAEQGELKNYKTLHFATHGIVVPDLPELSALVLSQQTDQSTEEDGYLNVQEVARLPLQADFVNLSACETGLGKLYGGEGVVGLTQAFLIAGANGLSVSLWQVSDESTAQFMVAVYQLVHKQQFSYADAMNEVKRRFIGGDFGEQWQAPYFWAPFVYYGE